MLKITIDDQAGSVAVKLEGKLTDVWLEELHRCWREVRIAHRQQPIFIDLTGVTFIGSDGKALLSHLWRDGAQFLAAGCLNMAMVEEITAAGRTHHPSGQTGRRQ